MRFLGILMFCNGHTVYTDLVPADSSNCLFEETELVVAER